MVRRILSGLCWSLPVALVLGCGTAAPPAKPAAPGKPSAATDDHHHGSTPHGGTLIDWGGGKYHVEFTVDHDKKESVVYVLGDDGKTASPIKTDKLLLSIDEPAFQLDLAAQPLDGEQNGVSSRFVGKHDNLGKVQEFAGTISGEIEGTPYARQFKESAEGHGHEHK